MEGSQCCIDHTKALYKRPEMWYRKTPYGHSYGLSIGPGLSSSDVHPCMVILCRAPLDSIGLCWVLLWTTGSP